MPMTHDDLIELMVNAVDLTIADPYDRKAILNTLSVKELVKVREFVLSFDTEALFGGRQAL